MKPRIDRRPTCPVGTDFLSSWTVDRPLYCSGYYECYKIHSHDEINLGVAILCRTAEESQKHCDRHLSWWHLQGEDRVKVLDCKITTRHDGYLILVSLDPINGRIPDEVSGTSLLNQYQAECLLIDLIGRCRLGNSQSCWPVIDRGTVVLMEKNEILGGVPLFVEDWGEVNIHSEAGCVESIASLVYGLATGIDPEEHGKKGGVPPASRWNKGIDRHFSVLLGLCLDQSDPQRIVCLTQLEAQLHGQEDHAVSQPASSDNDQERTGASSPQNPGGLSKVAGMAELKALLTGEVIRPIREPELFKRFGLTIPNGILLYGPPGCGKTFIARQLAEEMNFYFLEIVPSEVASPYIHASVLKIRDVFARAEEHAPSVVFIDEFEALVPSRSDLGGHQQYKSEEVNEFLVHLNDCASKGVFIIAATNEPAKIDDAIRRTGRLDKMIYVGPPDLEARTDLLRMYLSQRPIAKFDLQDFAELLDGYSCSDIRNIADESARMALREDKSLIDMDHLAEAIRRNPSSLSPEMLTRFGAFHQRGI